MAWNLIQDKSVFRSPMVRICIAIWLLLAIAMVSMASRVKRRYDRWSASRFASRAADYCAKADYSHALLDARSALELNRLDVEAIRVIAQSLEAVGSPDAIQWRRQFDQIQQGNAENTLAWARDAFQAGDFDVADRVLGTLKPAERENASYHDIAARIAMGKGDLRGAESHWAEAERFDPKEEQYRLNVATLRLRSRSPQARADALAALREMCDIPGKRLQALRTLLGESMDHGDGARAKELAKTLASDPQATFADQLTRLMTLRKLRAAESASFLTELRDRAASKPTELFQLFGWMNQHDLALMVVEWSSSLPQEVISKPPVCPVLAEAYDRALEWEKLQQIVEGDPWGATEFLRQAYGARVLAKLDDAAGSTAAWEAALVLAKKSPEQLEALTRMALDWGWKQKAREVARSLSSYERCPRWVLDTLWAGSLKRGESSELYRLSNLLARADPKNIAHRNNAVFLGLLIRNKEATAHEMASALYREAPGNANVVATYGLSCFQRGRAAEAVTLMETLKPEQLHEPGTARYYGIFLAAAKKFDQARIWLEVGAKGEMLPEERALMLGAKAASSDDSDAYLAQLNQFATSRPEELADRLTWMISHDLAPLVSLWSAGAAPEVTARPKVSMAIAEAHAKALEWRRLKETIEAASWGELDYLRSAYLSRAFDRLNVPVDAETAWKAAMEGAQESPESLEALARAVKGWGWEQKAGEVLWKLSSHPNCPRWAIESLWEIAVQQGDYGQLHKVGKLIAATDSKGVRIRNNAIVLGLLTHVNEIAIREFVESLFTETPGDAAVASIRALSLHQQGRNEEALAMMERFQLEQLNELRAAFYYGIFLTVARQGDQAKEYLEIAATGVLQIEENMLVTRARLAAKASPPPAPAVPLDAPK